MALAFDTKIYIAGHRGLAGGALFRELRSKGYSNLLTRDHSLLDLEDGDATRRFFEFELPQVVFLAAARVGGIVANNSYPVDFLLRNLKIELNVIEAAASTGVRRLIFLGSSCIYPRDCPQPMSEDYLLTGALEVTNRPYAIAKIAGIEMCWAHNRQKGTRFLAAMPTNLYGRGDNYDLENSHVLPALIRKIHSAKLSSSPEVVIWGSGSPRREFLSADDLAKALVFLAELGDDAYFGLTDSRFCPTINIGTGADLSIRELATLVANVIGFRGNFVYDKNRPDGTPRKLLDVSRLAKLGWFPSIGLREGIAAAYEDFVSRIDIIAE